MAPGKSKTTTANGSNKKLKFATPSANESTQNSAANPAAVDTFSSDFEFAVYGSGKPDKAVYEREQEQIKAQIDVLQAKVSVVKDKIHVVTKGGPNDERRASLKAELETIRGQQSSNKASRTKIRDELKAIHDDVQKKIKDLNAAKAKAPYKTVSDVDDRINNLEKQVESGNLKLGDEKRALAEISQLKRSRRVVEGFQADQESIEADRAKADELRKELDDPEAKAISERYDAIKAELDELKKEGDEIHANRNKLFDERNALQAQLDTLYSHKRESAQRFREANDKHWTKMNEERARRAEWLREKRAAEEEDKKKELVERLREEASIPAFQTQIEDCQTLIDYFSGRNSTPVLSTRLSSSDKIILSGVPELEIRKVETGPAEGMVARKKKGEEEEAYFVGNQRKGPKGKKGSAKASASSGSSGAEALGSHGFQAPFQIVTALLDFSISPPTSEADVPRVIEELKAKKAWFESNQARVTAENKEATEAKIRQITGKSELKKADIQPPCEDLTPPNGGGELPAEPASSPAVTRLPSVAVPSEDVVEKLEVEQKHDGDGDGAQEQ
ncbi:uncharacterized protein LAESUDRAFT_639920 [Laetiporus sulphureus 93-53]|uniref:Nuclear segregation protein Bfr1 n=1 Tax=Laetiporus sulphureus 93-53 TaxID=1314785 RepID=A0A165I8Q6_9APHY|nr:uncharacterized protein LAESUDRAFT_639920 [Laetiporus sulphureus 93-53]KZT12738.1 hypothetical protein LAESUDRAFT_639920 [Laetiporus sulphureus 93-53]